MEKISNLVGAAIGYNGNPFETPVGSKIDAATDDSLASENWGLFIEICDMINDAEEGPRDAVKAIRRKLQNSAGKNNTSTLYTLTVLATCAKNCRKPFHVLICQKDFIYDILINKVLSSTVEPPLIIQEKVLLMVQSWAHAFSPDPDLRGVAEIYMELKRKGVIFPDPSDDDLLLVESNQSSPNSQTDSLSSSHSSPIRNQIPIHAPVPSKHTEPIQPKQAAKLSASGRLTEGQVRKLQRDIEVTLRNMNIFSELLTDIQLGENHPCDKTLLVQISETCKEMKNRVLELIGIVHHRTLTAELLEINDNMNNLFLRYERYLNNKAPEAKPNPDAALSPSSIHLEVAPETAAVGRPASNEISSLSNPNDFEEMEAWMKEHDQEEKGDTSKEFEVFLEKRANASDK